MKEPYGKGLATRPGPESCAGHGNMTGEALTRVHAGQPLSSEINPFRRADLVLTWGRPHLSDAIASHVDRGVEDPAHAWKLLAREPGDPGKSLADGTVGRSERPIAARPDMHVSRESDGPIVPEKRANKDGPEPAAESVEGRGSTKGNANQTLLAPDTEPGKRGIGLWGVREAAKRDKKCRFTACCTTSPCDSGTATLR